MKKLLFIPAILFAVVMAAITQSPQAALAGGIGNNYIAPSVRDFQQINSSKKIR